MAFTHLPNELLREIIILSLPESFENLALTCKEIFALCSPFIAHHSKLRLHFRRFRYGYRPRMKADMLVTRPYPLLSAYMFIAQIAIDPVVARHVQEADLYADSQPNRYCEKSFQKLKADACCEEKVMKLLADSSYLQEAGLDWREYYTTIKEDFYQRRYSQYAAAFLLTLLPNVKSFTLPWRWESLEATDKLIDAIILRARQASPPHGRASIAQVTAFTSTRSLHTTAAFLSLPQVRHLKCSQGFRPVNSQADSLSAYQHPRPLEKIEEIALVHATFDEESMAAFLSHTPCLKSLHYAHSSVRPFVLQDWDFCGVINAIGCQVGTHLVKLSITIDTLRDCVVRGKALMRGFQRLEKLQFPLEIAMSNLTASISTECEIKYPVFFLCDLVPASVSELSLLSRGKDQHERALEAMFHDFAANKKSQVPALQKIYLSHHRDADNAYKEQCAKVAIEAEEASVILHLRDDFAPLPEWNYKH
ncbi:hypothetical protein UA08_06860 [Talaromyces atroroseus]|uniref:F-box domain-containing protein n=1 Tax=Talaromyces atroroseus TaxID=1441469 RepID=A0A225AFS0_TALAT|nr:hypothetical protein UA08_06860 [Talaromyces atroroseus]OKL57983.1 hypothetical protein UA08_06860 [Talaromyces atroroseus]